MPGENEDNEQGRRDSDQRLGQCGPHPELAELTALARISSQPLGSIPSNIPPEIRELAETLRVLFGALGMSLNRLAALLHSDPGTVSRYLSGRRVPPPSFIDDLCKAVYDVKGSLVTSQVQELVHEQFLVALQVHNPARYEVQRLTDLLQASAQKRRQYEITIAALEEAITSRNEKIYTLELEGRQLQSDWARAEGILDEESEHRERPQKTINSLNAEVRYIREQLFSAQRRAVAAEERCQELEALLDSAGALLPDEDHGSTTSSASLIGGSHLADAPTSLDNQPQGQRGQVEAGVVLPSDVPFLRIADSGILVPLRDGVTTVGSDRGVDVQLDDPSVGRLHAELVRRGPHVYVSDLGLSQNGTRVNGRPVARKVLNDGDVITFGAARARISGLRGQDVDAEIALRHDDVPELTRRELDVLISLCRPSLSEEAFTLPATAREIAADLVITEPAVKQHLLRLFAKFGIPEGPNRRTGLANKVIGLGLIRPLQYGT